MRETAAVVLDPTFDRPRCFTGLGDVRRAVAGAGPSHGMVMVALLLAWRDAVVPAPAGAVLALPVGRPRLPGLRRALRGALRTDAAIIALPFGIARAAGAWADAELERARLEGRRVCAAAGNSGAGVLLYPAASPHCLAITACDRAGRRLPESSAHATAIPIRGIFDCPLEGVPRSGTSVATMRAAAALCAGLPPEELDFRRVEALFAAARDGPGG